jgi:NTP pyrophosphatase (non-canonical NTP hydrolase)
MQVMTKVEHEIMAIAQEECAEVVQAISKIFRFGLTAKHPDRTYDNKAQLEEEIGDLICMVSLMVENGIVNESSIEQAAKRKRKKLETWSNIFVEKK